MRVKKLAVARGCGVFRDFVWPNDLATFEDRVLVYGWNGSGKTTFSSIIRELETGRSPFGDHDWEITTDTTPIRSGSGVTEPRSSLVRVFNSDFVAESVFSSGELAPVLYLGRGTRAKEQRLEECRAQLSSGIEQLATLAEAKEAAERQLDRFYVDQAKLIKEALRSSAQTKYNNYDKSMYRARVAGLRAQGSAPSRLRTEEDQRLRAVKDTQAMPVLVVLSELSLAERDARAAVEELARFPRSRAIPRLASDPEVGRWAEDGLRLHEHRSSEVCLFCDGLLAAATLHRLRAHFDPEFSAAIARIEALLAGLGSVRESVEGLTVPLRMQLSPSLRERYDELAFALTRRRTEFVVQLRDLEARLMAKRDAPFSVVEAPSMNGWMLSLGVDGMNALLKEHNDQQSRLASEIQAARDALADGLIAQHWPRLQEYERKVTDIDKKCEEATLAQRALQREADILEREIVEHLTPAVELTEELSTFLGRSDIAFEASGTGYTVTRLGKRAAGLSEGEKSAIALLYFLKTLNDRSFVRSEGVVVIDDPVSSLDSNALYCALAYLQDHTTGIGQVIFLTHNFAFFRELRKWLYPKHRRPESACSLFFLRCLGPWASRRASLESLDPLLRDFDSEYQYLFKLVWEASRSVLPVSLTGLFHYPNVARRLLEAFFAFRMPDISDAGLRSRLKQTRLDPVRRERILRFLDFQSHDDGVAVPDDDLSSLGEAAVVLQEVLDLMNAEDPEHFARMKRLVEHADAATVASVGQ